MSVLQETPDIIYGVMRDDSVTVYYTIITSYCNKMDFWLSKNRRTKHESQGTVISIEQLDFI